ncbi:MAG: hypothetical protein NC184_05570 [Roseburia sp.]|nr:hypothetical protein [Roseburia sp.]
MNTKTAKVEIEIDGIRYSGIAELTETERTHEDRKPTYKAWGVRIDRTNNDPESAVEYIGAAAGYKAARGDNSGDWADNPIFAKIKPCLFKDGTVVAYLDPNDYDKTIDGYTIETLRGFFDTMVEFGKMYYRIQKDDRYTYVEITDDAASLADGFTDYAFSYKGKARDKFYIGAYKGSILDGKLRSVSDATVANRMTVGAFRKAAQANGEGYEITPFNKLTLLQVLYVIRYKSLNSRAALGKGLTEAREFSTTGTTDKGGLYAGSQDGTKQVKCHGIEDLWGNIYEWIDGFVTTDGKIKIADGLFNDTGKGYETAADLPESIYGIITDVHGNNKLGFVPSAADEDMEAGEAYYCNYGSTWNDDTACVPFFGGSYGDGAFAGAFYFCCYFSASSACSSFGARLCFCGKD